MKIVRGYGRKILNVKGQKLHNSILFETFERSTAWFRKIPSKLSRSSEWLPIQG
jgi:hypothetical protein